MSFKQRGNSQFQRSPNKQNPIFLYFKAVGKQTESRSSETSATMTSSPCIFCLDEQRSPRRIPCGHSFCADCFERYLQLSQDSRCPLCRRDFRLDIQPASIRLSVPSAPSDPYALSTEAESDPDTLVLTLSEQECRFFEQLYREVRQPNNRIEF